MDFDRMREEGRISEDRRNLEQMRDKLLADWKDGATAMTPEAEAAVVQAYAQVVTALNTLPGADRRLG